jgi:PilZ domain
MSAKRQSDKRAYERIDVQLNVRLFLPDVERDELRFEAFSHTQNLCPGGMYLEASFLLKSDTRLWAELELPEGPFLARCRVAHRVELDDGQLPPGMGIEFYDVEAAGREQLLRYFAPERYAEFHKALVQEFPHIEKEVDEGTITLLLNLWEEWKIRQDGGPAATASGAPQPFPRAASRRR